MNIVQDRKEWVVTEENGWTIRSGRQWHKDYPPYFAIAQKPKDGGIVMFNEEGNTRREAVEKCIARIEKGNAP